MNNIILCGYKSCGKTTLGKKISEKTGMHFIDTDDLVSKNCRQLYTQMDSKLDCQVGSKRRKSIPAKRVVLANTSPLCGNRFSAAFNPAWQSNFESNWVYLHSAEAFREIEKDVIAALIDFQNSVIATGGGSVLAPENVTVLKKLGKIFYLRVPKQIIKERLLSGQLPAFLDPNRPEESFEEMYASRKDLYEQIADHIIDHEEQIWSLCQVN